MHAATIPEGSQQLKEQVEELTTQVASCPGTAYYIQQTGDSRQTCNDVFIMIMIMIKYG